MEFRERVLDDEEPRLRWLNSLSVSDLDLLREDVNHVIRLKKNYLDGDTSKPVSVSPEQNIEALKLDTSTYNFLRRADFLTIEDLMNASPDELARVHGLGVQRRKEVKDALLQYGFDYRQKWNDNKEG